MNRYLSEWSFSIVAMALSALCMMSPVHAVPTSGGGERPPNIIIIYADDLGYGDVGSYGATKVKTPNIDRLAAAGLRFTDGHCPSATCTPSRYAMLTGEYAWRRKGTGILRGNAPAIIEPGRPTLATMLKQAGYATGVVGKWHLGLGTPDGDMDWNGKISPGPLEIGFDYAFLIPATGDRVPCVYVENHRVVGLDPADPIQVSYDKKIGDEPTGRENPELLKMKLHHGHDQTIINGISRIGYMTGGKAARWVDEDMADVITAKAVAFIGRNKDKPFFLYFPTQDVHVPRVPHPRFVGTSGTGTRGDVIHQLDWCVGELMKALEQHGLTENTLVIFSSDNGPVLNDGYRDGAVEDLNGHTPAGPFRGGKYSLFEAGTRVPLIARWPQRIKPGVSDALVCHIDFFASFAALTGQKLSDDAAPDSLNTLAAFLGETKDGREHLVEHANGLALRSGKWKFIPPRNGPALNTNVNIETGASRQPQLYDLSRDLGEQNNLADKQPEKVKEMAALLDRIEKAGRTPTPGK